MDVNRLRPIALLTGTLVASWLGVYSSLGYKYSYSTEAIILAGIGLIALGLYSTWTGGIRWPRLDSRSRLLLPVIISITSVQYLMLMMLFGDSLGFNLRQAGLLGMAVTMTPINLFLIWASLRDRS